MIRSPLIEGGLEKQFEGGIYVLPSNPPEIKLLVAASADGINLKLVGTSSFCQAAGETLDGKTCQAPGQIVTVFKGLPQNPATVFRLTFEGGSKAALDTPTRCGSYTTTADFTPWSSPFVEPSSASSAFEVAGGVGGAACPSGTLPFTPSFSAGSTSTQAGGFTGFTMHLARGDGQQRLEKLSFTAPAGMAGLISKVPLCTNIQAEANQCPEASKIGHTVVTAGPGAYPLTVPQPGQPQAPIYLTEGYGGAPFGLSIVVPLHVGPFTLETQRVRAKIEINPTTGQITVATNPMPQIVDGVPTDLRSIDAVIDREGFMFNPTSCEPQQITGTASGTAPVGASEPGQSAGLSDRFDVGGCRELPFAPKLTASTLAKTSKQDGAQLTVKITAQPGEANIHLVHLQIPSILPTRDDTLKLACTEAKFAAGPGNCPEGSIIGTGTANTPILNEPLKGNAYLVSHGGAAFPDVEYVLKGEGVTIVLDGKTDIKNGITYSTFETVPDERINSFETVLPEGPHSIFAAYGSVCTQKLVMPTLLTGQNGIQLTQNTRIETEGCFNKITVTAKSIKNHILTLHVAVPAAGTLTATGRHLKTTHASSTGRESLTLTIHTTTGGRLTSSVKLTFKPSHGKTQTTALKARFKM